MIGAATAGGHPLWHLVLAPAVGVAIFGVIKVREWRDAGIPSPAVARLYSAPPAAAGLVVGSLVYCVALLAASRAPDLIVISGAGLAVSVLVTAAGAVAACLLVARRPVAVAGGDWAAYAAIAAGSAWTGWGIVDQHLLGAFVIAPGAAWSGLADAAFHGLGITVAGLGTWLVTRRNVRALAQ